MSLRRRSVKIIPFAGIENAFIILSSFSTKIGNGVRPTIRFYYGTPELGAEWEPECGPIEQCRKLDETDPEPNAKEHPICGFIDGFFNCSQLAVEREGLPEALLRGDYAHIYDVLKQWSGA
jgi:hypothetical protein